MHPVTGEVWTKGNDVAERLGYDEPSRTIDAHLRNKQFIQRWGDIVYGFTFRDIPSIWQPETIMINEVGVNILIMSSSLPNAQRFRDFVCRTMLPSSRKTVMHVMNTADVIPMDVDDDDYLFH